MHGRGYCGRLDSNSGEVVVKPTQSVEENTVDPDCDFRSNVFLQDVTSTIFQVMVLLTSAKSVKGSRHVFRRP